MLRVCRAVRYTDDGCSIHECLACKGRWESRSDGFAFCPRCGVRFEGHMGEKDLTERERAAWQGIYDNSKRHEEEHEGAWVIRRALVWEGESWRDAEDEDPMPDPLDRSRLGPGVSGTRAMGFLAEEAQDAARIDQSEVERARDERGLVLVVRSKGRPSRGRDGAGWRREFWIERDRAKAPVPLPE